MRAVLKVVRCNQYEFRLGIHILEQNIPIQNNGNILVVINENRCIEIQNNNWLNRYSSLIDAQIGEWILENGWTHESRRPMKLVLFTIDEHDGNLVMRYAGTSRYRKVSGRRLYVEDGQSIPPTSFENEIDSLWNNSELLLMR